MSSPRKTRSKSAVSPIKELKRVTKAAKKPVVPKVPDFVEPVKVEEEFEKEPETVIDNSDRPEKAKRKSVVRQEKKVEASIARKAEKKHLEEKYDVNLAHSDDSSDEEVLLRTGDVPQHWYDLYDHQGYSVDGKQVGKMVEKDELEKFIERQADKNWWRKITDRLNNKEVKLSMADIQLLQRMRQGKFVDKEIDPYNEEWNFETSDENFKTPFSSVQPPKSRFVQSKWERLAVSKIRQAIKKGWMKTPQQEKEEEERKEKEAEKCWDIWEDDSIVAWKPRKMPKAIVAPKRDLPMHGESFNPPEEYLFDDDEKKRWLKADKEDRETNYLPTKVDALRKVPLYQNLIKEHFERCLDLYLCPRLMKKKIQVEDPNALIPDLPSPEDLKPFPTQVSIDFQFHTTCVRTISISPNGLYLASGDEAGNLIIWNTRTSKIMRKYTTTHKVIDAVAWCPSTDSCLLLAANEDHVHVFAPGLYGPDVNEDTRKVLRQAKKEYIEDTKANVCKWIFKNDHRGEPMITMEFKNVISKLVWHAKGDYFATMAHNVQMTSQVLIHSIGRSTTQKPFSQTKGIVTCVAFHPTKPNFFACTVRTVFQYNLQKQSIVAKYKSGSQWISSITIHPKGDNFVLGTYDKKVIWFDMDMGSEPYKNMKYNDKAIRDVSFHQGKWPLLASASDDGSLNIFYAMVYNDLLQNALVTPVKVLKNAHLPKDVGTVKLGAMACEWHPNQPWLFTAGADGQIKLWV